MSGERAGFVNVDELMARVSLDQALTYYQVELPDLHRIGDEIRTRCFSCGTAAARGKRGSGRWRGEPEHPAKIWRCHEAGCGRGGNRVSLCDLLKPGEHRASGPPTEYELPLGWQWRGATAWRVPRRTAATREVAE